MSAPLSPSTPEVAPLENPLYYLDNAHTLIDWVRHLHGDLLSKSEQRRLQAFEQLPRPSRALVLRMVMRSHDRFRLSELNYAEIGNLDRALKPLIDGNWVDAAPLLDIVETGRLLRKGELFRAFAATLSELGVPAAASKNLALEALASHFGSEERRWREWWPEATDAVIALGDSPLFRRIRLMFFGNLRQDWSEFVIAALGHRRYEPVPLDRDCRAFHHRREVDSYLALYDLGERLEAGEEVEAVLDAIPQVSDANPWLARRRRRLLHRLGHRAERQGDIELARQAYLMAWDSPSRIRYFRMNERHGTPDAVLAEARRALAEAESPLERDSLERVIGRLARKLGNAASARKRRAGIPSFQLTVAADPSTTVEQQAARALSSDGAQCFYVENGLFNGLLGLLCWPAIFAPVPGAFFHPFQAGPADLFRDEFVPLRRQALERCLALLEGDGYRQQIRHYWSSRRGVACPLVAWGVLTEEVVNLSLHCIPADHLEAIFRRQLGDLGHFRRGLPDLVCFRPDRRSYELIEVKAPGDRLQDHQRHWFEFFADRRIPARVCNVMWAES